MEFLLEFIFELIFEGSVELSANKRVSKWIRYPLIAIFAAFWLGLVAVFFGGGIYVFPENKLFSLLLIGGAIFLLAIGILVFRKKYLHK